MPAAPSARQLGREPRILALAPAVLGTPAGPRTRQTDPDPSAGGAWPARRRVRAPARRG